MTYTYTYYLFVYKQVNVYIYIYGQIYYTINLITILFQFKSQDYTSSFFWRNPV